MKTSMSVAVFLALFATASWAQHHAVRAADLKWSPVPSLPRGAQIAVMGITYLNAADDPRNQ